MYSVDIEKIKCLMLEKGYNSNVDFAEKIGITYSSLRRYLKNPKLMPQHVICSVAELLEITYSEMVMIFFKNN